MNNDHCTVFLKESLRKTHFDSFSAVSKAPEACELSWCAEFNALATPGTKTTRRAQKTRNFRRARSAPRRGHTKHTLRSLPYQEEKKGANQEVISNLICTYSVPRASWRRNKGGVFIYDTLANKVQNLSRIRADLAKLWSRRVGAGSFVFLLRSRQNFGGSVLGCIDESSNFVKTFFNNSTRSPR